MSSFHKRCLASLIALLTAWTVTATAEETATPKLSAATRWVIHADIAKMRENGMAELIGFDKGLDIFVHHMSGDTKKRGVSVQGIDVSKVDQGENPLRKIASLTVCGTDSDSQRSLFYVRGEIRADALIDLIKNREGYATETYADETIHSWTASRHGPPPPPPPPEQDGNAPEQGPEASEGPDPQADKGEGPENAKADADKDLNDKRRRSHRKWRKRTINAAFLADGTFIMTGDKERLKNAIDVLKGKAPALEDPAIAGNAPDRFLFVAVRGLSELRDKLPEAVISRKIKTGRCSFSVADNHLVGTLHAQAIDQESAEQIRAIVSGWIAFGVMNGEDRPDMALFSKALRLDGNEDTVNLELKLPIEDLKKIFEERRRKMEAMREKMRKMHEKKMQMRRKNQEKNNDGDKPIDE